MPESLPHVTAEEMAAETNQRFEENYAQAVGGLIVEHEATLNETSDGSNLATPNEEQGQLRNIRPEDEGRIHDVDTAHEQALHENEIFDVWAQAHRENEMFDLHAEALKEDEERTRRLQAESLTDKTRPKEINEQGTARSEQGIRKQAEVALRDAGYKEHIPAESRVRLDSATGNLMIIGNHEVKVVEPRSNGRARVTEYDFDESNNVLTMSARGANTITATVGDFMPSPIGEDQLKAKEIILPVAVAQVIGFRRAIPVGASRRSFELAA